jgi:hypothetical protein
MRNGDPKFDGTLRFGPDGIGVWFPKTPPPPPLIVSVLLFDVEGVDDWRKTSGKKAEHYEKLIHEAMKLLLRSFESSGFHIGLPGPLGCMMVPGTVAPKALLEIPDGNVLIRSIEFPFSVPESFRKRYAFSMKVHRNDCGTSVSVEDSETKMRVHCRDMSFLGKWWHSRQYAPCLLYSLIKLRTDPEALDWEI